MNSIIPKAPKATAAVTGLIRLGTDLGGTADAPNVVGIKESGGQDLSIAAVADGQFLKRSGTTVTSGTPTGTGPSFATLLNLISVRG